MPKHSPRVYLKYKQQCSYQLKGGDLHSLAERGPEPPCLSLPRLPSLVYLVSSPPFHVRSQPLICYSIGGPTRGDGRPLRAIMGLGRVSENGERGSNALAGRGSHPKHRCSRSWTRSSFHVAVSRGSQDYDQGCGLYWRSLGTGARELRELLIVTNSPVFYSLRVKFDC